ncbi:MAG: ATP synthase F1 subunit epsilon [Planctomycetota bacterium]|nr:ATP synthase F1 subunit epsilon [Planctomycetota bacterium]
MSLQCVVVTPEQTELDVPAQSVTIPMFDGEIGILKGHSPLVGRLGYGVLRVKGDAGTDKYFIDGGFAQVDSDVVSILTDKLIPMSDITSSAADAAMKEAMDLPSDTDAAAREKAITRARVMSRVAGT